VRFLAVAAVAVACVSCGSGGYGSSSTPSSPTTTTPPPNAVTINIVGQNGNLSFSPNPAAAGGHTVVFKNTDSIPHQVVLNDGSINTGVIAPGATSAPVQMPSTGTNYHCAIHPTMIGAIDAASGDAPPACTGAYCDGSGASY
jgi:plastocyanin